tara:strand:- start:6097 stop:6681 length:585 start_codon:yes stop_codon:yes gene_type:complete
MRNDIQGEPNTMIHPNTYHVFLSYTANISDSPFGLTFMNNSHEMIMSLLGDELDNYLDGSDQTELSDQDLHREISRRLTNRFKEEVVHSLEMFLESINFRVQRSVSTQISCSRRKYFDMVCKMKSSKKNIKNLGLDFENQNDFVCPICLDVLKYNRIWHHPKNCNHVYHPECLKKYVNYNDSNSITCPVCRIDM